MGPISDLSPELLAQFMSRLEELSYNRQVTGDVMQSVTDYTKSGRPVPNISQSRAVMPAFGETVGNMVGKQASNNIEEAALRAAQALGTPTSVPATPGVTRIPTSRVPGVGAVGGPLMLFLELLLRSGELNSGESKDLADRRTKQPTLGN